MRTRCNNIIKKSFYIFNRQDMLGEGRKIYL